MGYKKIYNSDYYFDENGKLYKIQYNPIQYYQNDSRWANVSYNGRTMKSTGCAPTSMAMAFSTILRRYVSPVEVANYLYYHTNTFNRWCMGADGNAIVMAANYFGVKRTALDYSNSVAIKNALKAGKIVFAAMGNGKFGGSTWNHAIVLSGLDQYGRTYAYDPLFPNKNGWVSVDQIIREHSAAADDAWGGSYFHALESYNVYI